MQLEIFLKRTTYLLFSIIGLLVATHVSLQLIRFATPHGYIFGIIDRFDVDKDIGIPAWFSQMQLFAASILLGIIALHKQSLRDSFARHWAWLAVIFFYLSIDEGATLHEIWVYPVLRVFKSLPSFLGYAWVLPFALLVVIVFAAYVRFLKALPPLERRGFLVSGFMFVFGALVMEMIGAQIMFSGMLRRYYLLSVTIEELLEMTAIALFIVTLLGYIGRNIRHLTIKFHDEGEELSGRAR